MKLNTFKQSILAYLCNTCQKQFQSKFLSMLKNIIIFEINNKQKDYFHFSLLITKPPHTGNKKTFEKLFISLLNVHLVIESFLNLFDDINPISYIIFHILN